MSHRFLIQIALALGIVVLVVEGYYVYRFYANPTPGIPDSSLNVAERTAPAKPGTTTSHAAPSKQENKAKYLSAVGDIQNKSVEALLESSAKLRNYDALNAKDVEELSANMADLNGYVDQVQSLEPPEGYGDQYKAFSSGITEIRDATELAYRMAADPVNVTQSDFETYQDHATKAIQYLKQSNKALNKDYPIPESTKVTVASGL